MDEIINQHRVSHPPGIQWQFSITTASFDNSGECKSGLRICERVLRRICGSFQPSRHFLRPGQHSAIPFPTYKYIFCHVSMWRGCRSDVGRIGAGHVLDGVALAVAAILLLLTGLTLIVCLLRFRHMEANKSLASSADPLPFPPSAHFLSNNSRF